MKGLHALLVDDDPEALATMATILEMDDFLVTTALEGQEALVRLERADSDKPAVDFLVADLDMAGLSGIELILELKRRDRRLPVMVVTAFASRATVVELLRQGVTDFLDKPVHMEELRSRVHRIAQGILQNRREGSARTAEAFPLARTRSATLLDVADLGIPYAARKLEVCKASSNLTLACRRQGGFDLLLAETDDAAGEGFYISVLIRSWFEERRRQDPGGEHFLRDLAAVVREGSLQDSEVRTLYLRVRTEDRRIEVYPAGYPARLHLDCESEGSRMLDLAGVPLGRAGAAGETLCMIPFCCGDRLLILGGDPSLSRRFPITVDRRPPTLEGWADDVWSGFLAGGGRDRSLHDVILLAFDLR